MPDMTVVELSRLQFALTAMYHFLFVPLTLGLSFMVAIMESVYVMTGRDVWRRMTLLWGTLFVRNVVASRNNSAAAMIKRSAIQTVTAHPPRPPLTRGYFAVFFEEEGRLRKRLIMLPGSMHGGREQYRRAEAIMDAAGLLRARQ
jgi:hypothetical protein